MDDYDAKFHNLQTYIPFLEERIEKIKKIKLQTNYPDPEKEKSLNMTQGIHKILLNRENKRLKFETMNALEKKLKVLIEQDRAERSFKNENRRDLNPYHLETCQPSSSCSNNSGGSITTQKKVFDDCPASPSPPTSPLLSSKNFAPIIIPTVRHTESPPPFRSKNRHCRSPTPPALPNIIPITKINASEQGPKEWDSDGEIDPEPQSRPKIIIPIGVPKNDNRLPKKEEFNRWNSDYETKRYHAENLPTVQVGALEGSRRLSSVLEKTKVLQSDYLINPLHVMAPPHNVSDMRSPESEIFGRQSHPQTMPRNDIANVPTLLLNAPKINAKPPIAIDDLSEFLDDQDTGNFRSRDQPYTPKHPSIVPKPISRVGTMPDLLGSRPEKTVSPLTDPRLSNDPRSRLNSDPRSNNVAPRTHNSVVSNDPRNHNMAVNDPRSMGGTIPRYPSENFNRSMTSEMIPPGEFQRSRQFDQYNQDFSVMGTSPVYGIPGPGPSTGYTHNQMDSHNQINSHNQMSSHNQMNYDYRMNSIQSGHWNGPSGHISSVPQPNPNNSYPVLPQAPNIRPNMTPQSSWQNPGAYNSDMHQPHSERMNSSYTNQMTNVARPQTLMAASGYAPPKLPSYDRSSYDMSYNQHQPSNDYRRSGWNGSSQGPPGEQRNYNRPFFGRSTGPPNSWNQNRDLSRSNRDPRMQRADNPPQQNSENTQKDTISNKEVTAPNKSNKLPEKPESIMKKRLEKMSLDKKSKEKKDNEKKNMLFKDKVKEKEKLKEKDQSKEKGKSKDKDKTKSKKKDTDKASQLVNRYGTIDAKKSVQVSGLNKFKIPKKRLSVEVPQEHTDQPTEQECSSANTGDINEDSHEDTTNHKVTETKKTKEKHSEKNKSLEKQKEKSKPTDEKFTHDTFKKQIIETLTQNFADKIDKENLSSVLEGLIKNLSKKKPKKGVILYSSSDDDSSSSEKPYSSLSIKSNKKNSKQASVSKLNSSPEESVDTETEADKEKEKLSKQKKIVKEIKVSLGKLNVNELRRTGKLKASNFTDKEQGAEKETTELSTDKLDDKPESVIEPSACENEHVLEFADNLTEVATETPPVKPKAKRRNRELETLQEDLKASWMCEGLMNTTNTRSCSQKNKVQENVDQSLDEEPRAGKSKKTGPKSRTRAKKAIHSESEDEDPLAIPKVKKTMNKKTKPKNAGKIGPPPLFDDSSNDEFNLDASVVEPSLDISLHPESNDKTSKPKKIGKKSTNLNEVESSSDESFVSNSSSSLLLDSTGKPRDNNEELLDDVMHQLASNPKYSRAKKKQIKKKKSSWQNGVLSKSKRKKKTAAQNKNDGLSFSNEDVTNNDIDENSSDKKLNTSSSFENIDEENNKTRFDTTEVQDYVSIDTEALIAYTIPDGNPQTQCLICRAFRKNIVQHYKINHPGKEVFISRLPVVESQLAIQESKYLDQDCNIDPPNSEKHDNFNCRFCSFVTKGINKHAKESFYEHLTTHTGEYRFGCLTCGYECHSKNSIRSHYYKECKKHSPSKNLADSTREDSIPDESRIYGFMCSKCHFLQLKKENVLKHVNMLHKNDSKELKIVKIDMSLQIKNEINVKKENSALEDSIKDEKYVIDSKDSEKNIKKMKNNAKCEIDEIDTKENVITKVFDTALSDPEISITLEAVEAKPEKKDNLSAFVCAEELDEKDLEIQIERKKKMQEIVANIGIKVNSNETKKRLSIIDQLKDKITLAENDVENRVIEEVSNIVQEPSEEPDDPLQISTLENKDGETSSSSATITEQLNIKEDPDDAKVNRLEDMISSKLMDPLAFVDEPVKLDEEETSDMENRATPILLPPVHYDSDSSNGFEQEEATDVNTILQQSTDNNVPAKKGHMLTTIQRLAAQIHNNKQPAIDTSSLPEPQPETIVADMPPVKIKTENLSPKKLENESLDVFTSSPKIKKEVKAEPLSPSRVNDEENIKLRNDNTSQSKPDSSPPKFIRIRRISGDKLSKGGDQEANNEDEQSFVSSAVPESNNDNSGFIRIENVMSLANPEKKNQMVQILPKPAEHSSPKSISILKKPSYIIQHPDGLCSVMTSQGSVIAPSGEPLKIIPITLPTTSPRSLISKPENVISIAGQTAVSIKIDGKGIPLNVVSNTCTPISTNLIGSPKSSLKYIKLIPSNDQKNIKLVSPEQIKETVTAIKLKSAAVYEKMLQDDKLLHLFKCMGRDCFFTTSYEQAFQKHSKLHEQELNNIDGHKDYLKCAYCYIDFNTYSDLMTHLKSMHTFCRFCCKFCFYRAFAHSYVELHQKNFHPLLKSPHILTVNEELLHLPPQSKRLDRKQIVKPYVCEHGDCKKYFFISEAFALHINIQHAHLINQLKCHVCKEYISSADALIAHYKIHGYFQYHCLYCVYGAATLREMHNHLSLTHYNQPPEILERRLPQEVSKQMSAIDQLKIRDIDLIYRQNKNVPDEELQKATQSSSLVPFKNVDSGISNIRIIDSRSLNTSRTGKDYEMNKDSSVSKATNDDDDDSDVEIIEEKSTSTSKNTIKNPEVNKSQVKEEASDVSLESQTSNPNSSSNSKESGNITGRFLTLDDIIGTGSAGPDLFRCGTIDCSFAANSKEELIFHMKKCSLAGEEDGTETFTVLHCVHCSKRFGKIQFFMDHLMTHGLKRYKCGLCDSKFALQFQAQTHLRQKHKYSNSLITPADPANPAADGLFIVHPQTAADKIKSKKLSKSPEKAANPVEIEKTVFYPNEIDKLPLQSIFGVFYHCAVCKFANKVRSNMLRHLQAHLNDKTVPDSSPVNPVPCLDKKERMFDKMVNLASSSHENGRMGSVLKEKDKEKIRDVEEDGLPKFVPEHQRYVCGVPECKYLTVEESMLRHHMKVLHSEQTYYKCPHCTSSNDQDQAQNIPLDKMQNHFKMHDSRLFKCSYCIYYHYQRHVVERHLMDKHSDKPAIVKVIRDSQLNQVADSQLIPDPLEDKEDDQPDPDGNAWKCCLCDFKSVYKGAMQNHALIVHGEKDQYQCNCGHKAISKIHFDKHLQLKHSNDKNLDYSTFYKRIKPAKKPESETVIPQGEPFDTTPLWRRDRIGVRHIRGILVEEEEQEIETTKKRKLDTDTKSTKIKKEEIKTETVERTKKIKQSSQLNENLSKVSNAFGSFGKPNKDMYACPMCHFKSKTKGDFKEHLYRDLKYNKWLCSKCTYSGVNRRSVILHSRKNHQNEDVEPVEGPMDDKIEKWVLEALIHQSEILKGIKKADDTDEEDLVIDTKDEEDGDFDDASQELLPEPLSCKHCKEKFAKWRGFKRHVQLMHLRRLRFCCPYCDQSTNSEAKMMQHVRAKHSDKPEKVIENQNTNTADLTDEFWEKEYGLVIPKRSKKRKRKEDDNLLSKVEIEHPCDKCDFTASTNEELKIHLKTHEMKIRLQCSYCSFNSFKSSEMRQHWEVNHFHREFMCEEAYVTPVALEIANRQASKKLKLDEEKKSTVFYCFYCNLGSVKLDTIRNHWKEIHKDESRSVFKYKEHSENIVKCAYCAEPGTKATLVDHISLEHGKSKEILLVEKEEDGWLCKWASHRRCRDFISTKEEMEKHQTFHPNVTADFKLIRRSFYCKECKMDMPTLESMQKHSKIHLNAYKCKHCNNRFKSFTMVKHHFALHHPEFEAETQTITSDDLSKESNEIVAESSVYSDLRLSPVTVLAPVFRSPPTSPRIAKKSTTKQILSPRRSIPIKPFPQKIRAVARKSTNPLPRYPEGTVFEIEERKEYISYYNTPVKNYDLSKINIEMAVGHIKMKVNCSKLRDFGIDIDAKPKIFDFMKRKRI